MFSMIFDIPPPADVALAAPAIVVKPAAKIDWKLKENGNTHHTDRYKGQELVVRRGQPFDISLALSGTPPAADRLTFTVETGSTSALQAKTRVAFGISGAPGSHSWGAVQTSTSASSTTLSFSISSPANAAIGRYSLDIQTGSGGSGPSSLRGTFVLLFNPWLSGTRRLTHTPHGP
ncbi:hypothetical protein JD844_015305 [Phrynosoma platyrhinos]|uniref:Transglutaminase N-terminal domain-containing protein n=1 Tax=Phrynosoma platyrhinos TaxID=52577 RepID=A0ABQ7T1L6_PHRPL|nr:hypothetical protein JD844_015305 [Phrynosoma platyrhinos]